MAVFVLVRRRGAEHLQFAEGALYSVRDAHHDEEYRHEKGGHWLD